jgi:hypothetical protein
MPGKQKRNWSQDVTTKSDALDLEPEVFAKPSAEEIAQSLKHSAEVSPRRKGSAFQSAMSMLTFYINRAGRNLPASRKRTLEAAKGALRQVFGRAPYLPDQSPHNASDPSKPKARGQRRD